MIHDIGSCFSLIFDFLADFWNLFNSQYVRFAGAPVPLSHIIIALIGISFILAAVWKGAKA